MNNLSSVNISTMLKPDRELHNERKVVHFITSDDNHRNNNLYSEWILLSKENLIKRESALLSKRVEHIQRITNEQIEIIYGNSLKNTAYIIQSDILQLCSLTISTTLSEWKGVKVDKTIASRYDRFRDYFKIAKNWWDQRKSTVLGDAFWVPILCNIQKFVQKTADIDADTRQLQHVMLRILSGLFHDNVRYANTKQQPLIPNGVIKNCDQLKRFLLLTHRSLNVDLWLHQQITHEKQMDHIQNRVHKRTGKAKIIAEKLRSNLITLSSSTKPQLPHTKPVSAEEELQDTKYADYNKIIFYLADKFITDNNNNNIINNNNHNNGHNQSITPPLYFTYAPQTTMSYNGSHRAPDCHQVLGKRFNPLLATQISHTLS